MNKHIADTYIDNIAESARICANTCLKKDQPAGDKEITCLGTDLCDSDQCNQKLVNALGYAYQHVETKRSQLRNVR